MRRFAFQVAAVLFIVTFPCVSFSAIYRWVDEKGVVTFKDTPPPEGVQGQVVDATPSFSGSFGGGEAASHPAPAPVTRNEQPKVEIYTTAWCPYCKSAVNLLKSNNIRFTEYDIEKDQSAARRKDQLDSRPGVPFAVINGRRIHGFDPSAYREALGLEH